MPQTPIDYAPPIPIHRRRRVQRIAESAVLIVLLGYLGYTAWPKVWRHGELLYYQYKAMSYSPPANQVVFDSNPARFRRAIQPGYFIQLSGGQGCMALPAERFTALTSPPSQYSEATLFLGKRKNSSGEERLVYVTMHGIFPSLCLDDPVSYLGIDIRIYQSGTWLTEPRGAGRIQVPPLIKIRKANEFVRFFAGQPASDDASHFSIAYEIGDKRSFIDGCLMDDDSVKLEKRR